VDVNSTNPNDGKGIEQSSRTDRQPMPAVDKYRRDTLDTRPSRWAICVQDKMEFQYLILNVGLRLDCLGPAYMIPEDWTQANSLYIPECDVDLREHKMGEYVRRATVGTPMLVCFSESECYVTQVEDCRLDNVTLEESEGEFRERLSL
jgi:hypothetical protein